MRILHFIVAVLLLFGLDAGANEAIGRRVSGRVVNGEGAPLARATVVLAQGEAVKTTRSDASGQFTFEAVPLGPYQIVATMGKSATTVEGEGDGPITLQLEASIEVIDIHELPPPAVPSHVSATERPRRWPYSDEAINRNQWALVWVEVLVDERGAALEARILKSPKDMDLDEIALRTAKRMKYEPALDENGKPIVSTTVVLLQWPPYWSAKAFPPCKGSGPLPDGTGSRFGREIESTAPTEGITIATDSYRDCEPPKGYAKWRLKAVRPRVPPMRRGKEPKMWRDMGAGG